MHRNGYSYMIRSWCSRSKVALRREGRKDEEKKRTNERRDRLSTAEGRWGYTMVVFFSVS